MFFLDKSFGEWNKVEKPTVIPMSCEVSNDEVEMVLVNYENNKIIIM